MARAKVESKLLVTLELTKAEALWLHGISQNGMQSSESIASQDAREGIFCALADTQIITKLKER